jgi:hypothetical protein
VKACREVEFLEAAKAEVQIDHLYEPALGMRVHEIALGELSQGDKPIERLIPSRHAVRSDHGGSVGGIVGQ